MATGLRFSTSDTNAATAETLLRWAILLVVFDGDANAWLDFLEREGSRSQRVGDMPFARDLARRCGDDTALSRQLRGLAQASQ